MLYSCGVHWELFHLESLEPQSKNKAPAAVSNSCDVVFLFFKFYVFILRLTGAVFCGLVNVLGLIV